MKKGLSFLLIVSLVIQLPGCYTFQSLENFDIVNLKDFEDKTLKIILLDSREFYSEKFHHTFVADSTRFIIATGSRYKKTFSKPETFKGKLYPHDIKSISYNKQNKTYSVLMTNEEIIRAGDKDYFEVTADYDVMSPGTKTIIYENSLLSKHK